MTTPLPATLEELRRDVSEILEDPEVLTLAGDDDLLELGIDSMRMMTLVTRWNERGVEVGFVELIEEPSLDAWLALLSRGDRPGA
ncbi:phosphopantetheine-binding protein [Tomitella gaofuii]|uniref:phosphopantetheine-binding protein n=1 Tax=Tomitella gaofuii TaxID=2760083 RepID=UPI001C714E20|nr:phosphopantetheine-binding protein [Tomitella gaofuii]